MQETLQLVRQQFFERDAGDSDLANACIGIGVKQGAYDRRQKKPVELCDIEFDADGEIALRAVEITKIDLALKGLPLGIDHPVSNETVLLRLEHNTAGILRRTARFVGLRLKTFRVDRGRNAEIEIRREARVGMVGFPRPSTPPAAASKGGGTRSYTKIAAIDSESPQPLIGNILHQVGSHIPRAPL